VGELIKIPLPMLCLVCYVCPHHPSRVPVRDIYRAPGTSILNSLKLEFATGTAYDHMWQPSVTLL